MHKNTNDHYNALLMFICQYYAYVTSFKLFLFLFNQLLQTQVSHFELILLLFSFSLRNDIKNGQKVAVNITTARQFVILSSTTYQCLILSDSHDIMMLFLLLIEFLKMVSLSVNQRH